MFCLITKMGKMVKIQNSLKENEIHRVDSPFIEDSKTYSFSARPEFRGGPARKIWENGQ